jgi:DNA-directed RNA polymerase subunit K/omega
VGESRPDTFLFGPKEHKNLLFPRRSFIRVPETGKYLRDFCLAPVVAAREKKKARRAAEEGFEIKIGPPKLTRFEKARIIGARSLQLAMGAPFFVPLDESTKDPIVLAMAELASEALPLSIRRSLPNGEFQDIPVRYLL